MRQISRVEHYVTVGAVQHHAAATLQGQGRAGQGRAGQGIPPVSSLMAMAFWMYCKGNVQ